MSETNQYPQIERAVVTILARSLPDHPVLREYVRAIGADPDLTQYLDEFVASNDELLNRLEEFRAEGPPTSAYAPHTEDWYEAFLDGTAVDRSLLPDNYIPQSQRTFNRRKDGAVAKLSGDLIHWRRAGRPEGDTTTTLHGVGGPVAIVTTSLAASLAKYVSDIENAWASLALKE